MAPNYFDVIAGLKDAWVKFKDKDVLRWTAIYMVGELAIMLGMFITLIGVIVFGASGKGDAVPLLVGFAVLLAELAGLVAFAAYAIPRTVRAAMKAQNIPLAKNPPSVLDYFVFSVRLTLVNLSCWYDRKLLAPALALLVLTVLATFAAFVLNGGILPWIPAIVLASLFACAWGAAALVHAERTKFAVHMYLRGDGTEREMPLKSYRLVHGQTFEVFLAGFLGGAGLYVIRTIIDIFGRVLMYMLLIPLFLLGAGVGSGGMLVLGILLAVLLFLASVFAWAFIEMALWRVYLAGMFKYYDKMGPVKKKAGDKTRKKTL